MKKSIHTLPKSRKYWFCVAALLIIHGCTVTPPEDGRNICHIFENHPDWYIAARHSERRWGLPVYVQMAIMKYESHFDPEARPPREMVLGLIPGDRPSTAYGFSQALDGTWEEYQRDTGNQTGDRDKFQDATDFMGWYSYKALKKAGIRQTDPYNLYLAYHDGIKGYLKGTYHSKAWLINVAKKVRSTASLYKTQLSGCIRSLSKHKIQ